MPFGRRSEILTELKVSFPVLKMLKTKVTFVQGAPDEGDATSTVLTLGFSTVTLYALELRTVFQTDPYR